MKTISRYSAAVMLVLMSGASTLSAQGQSQVQVTGVSAFWILANFSYAGMRAQNHPSFGWRIAAFLCGLPGTLLTWFFVTEGEERIYGVELPTRRR